MQGFWYFKNVFKQRYVSKNVEKSRGKNRENFKFTEQIKWFDEIF